MNFNNTSILKDERTGCFSTIVEITTEDYLVLVQEIYSSKGGLKGQREPLKSSSAMRIRRQMVKDIKAGTILPPIVLGLVITEQAFGKIPEISNKNLAEVVQGAQKGNLTIIDGMQRTTALIEAREEGAHPTMIVRVEFWIATNLNSLIYRMLVLNTGQVPWNIRRQVETVFDSMINEMCSAVPEMEVYSADDANRRSQGGQYHANDLIELYLAFGSRKEKVDTKERLADEFTRLDFIEATENNNFSDSFYLTLRSLTKLDIEFSKYSNDEIEGRFKYGKDLFKSQPARVGFATAMAKKIYGRPGFEKNETAISEAKLTTERSVNAIIEKVSKMEVDTLGSFLSLTTLNEKLGIKSSRVGDFEREFFTKAFETMLEIGEDTPSMEVCWQSY